MMLRTSWLLLLLLTLALSGVFAQKLPASVDFEHLTIPGSVRSSEVLDMIQDPEGVIWIATDGLIRYDGYAFTTYKLLPDSSSIGGQEINCLLYDQHQRRILVGTRNHGVVEYSYKTNRLRALPVSEGYPYVNSLVQTADGTIWASDFTSGIFYLQNDTVTRFSSRAVINPTSPYAWQDKLLVGQGSSILVFRNQSLVDSIPLLWENRKLNIYGRVTALHHDQQSRLYVGTEKQGVLIYDTDKRAFVDYLKPENNPLYNRINKIHIDREGLVWILTKGGGIALYSPKEKRLVTINKNILNLNSLSHDNCLSILEDQTGIIWVGSLGDLNKYDADQIRIAHLTYNPLQINSLSDKVVRGMIEDDESYLLAGTDGGYLNRINPVTLAVQKIEVTLPGYTGIVVPFYFTDFDKDHFLVSTNVGLLTMHKRSRTFRYYQPLYPYIEKSPVRQTIFHRGKLYYISSGSFAIYDPATQQHIKYYYSSPDPKFHIANPTSIFIDSHDRVWLGVRGGVKLIHDDFSTTDFTLDTRTRRPEGNYFMVLSMNEIDNKLWIGSFDSGLFTLDISQGINQPGITRISLPADFITTSIYSTLPDEAGNIWLSTNHGLLSYNPVSKLFNRFTLNEGLQDLEFNRLAYCKLRSGKMAFGGINGINVFDPAALQIKTISVKPSILSISSFSGKGNPFFMDVRSDSSVVLDATSNSFSIHFITPNYE
ncbi:MAG: hypothetical protein MUE95_07690, partial [Cyclobacteriaceae bacterium]|nr:hypothetical protein [Cyclobacteriaceae bacterium]